MGSRAAHGEEGQAADFEDLSAYNDVAAVFLILKNGLQSGEIPGHFTSDAGGLLRLQLGLDGLECVSGQISLIDEADGRTGGGLNKKLRTIMDGLRNPVAFLLSSGSDHDFTYAIHLLNQVNISGSTILADQAFCYGAVSIRAYVKEFGASYPIPPKSNVPVP